MPSCVCLIVVRRQQPFIIRSPRPHGVRIVTPCSEALTRTVMCTWISGCADYTSLPHDCRVITAAVQSRPSSSGPCTTAVMSAAIPEGQNPGQRTARKQPARRKTAEAALDWRNLPVDVWEAIARAALHLEGDNVRAWARLSLVNSAWRAGLQGVLSQLLTPYQSMCTLMLRFRKTLGTLPSTACLSYRS